MDCPIQKVRLLEDRAFVTRCFTKEMEAGQHKLILEQFTPVAVDKSLNVRGSSGLEIHDSRIVRRPLVESKKSSQEAQRLQEQVEQLNIELKLTEERASVCGRTTEAVHELFTEWLKQSAEDVVWDKANPEEWPEAVDRLRSSLMQSAEQETDLRQEVAKLREKREDLVSQLDNLAQPNDDIHARLEIDLELAEPNSVELEIEYCVPAACWRPYHRAEWSGDELNFRAQACVWQHTGEDWSDVQLSFSTQRAVLGTEPPKLSRDLLSLQKKQKTVVVETREESVKVLEKTVEQMPGIDDGGEVLNLEAPHTASIPSDGRPYRVELFCFQGQAEAERTVLAELSHCLFLNSRQTNTSTFPLLAGPVDLVKGSGLVGKSSVEFVAPGQSFVLSWGPDPSIRVHRVGSTGKEDSSFASSWKSTEHKVEINLSSLGEEAKSFEVTERIPVSELKHVKIEQHIDKTTGKKKADENGFVKWKIDLPGRGRKKLELAYTLSKKKSVEGNI